MGEWNWRLIFWVGVGLFLLVYFGHNPADEIRKKRAERASKHLVERIEEANKKSTSRLPMNKYSPEDFGLVKPINRNGSTGITNRPGQYIQPGTMPGSATPGGENSPNGNTDANNPNAARPWYATPPEGSVGPTGPGISAKPQDGYYPPAPKNTQAKVPFSSLSPDNSSSHLAATKALYSANRITDSGQKLVFQGTKVFTYNEDGRMVPMPDGEYPMFNGQWTMVVRGGAQTIANGDTTNYARAIR